jgi:hypothetical protein
MLVKYICLSFEQEFCVSMYCLIHLQWVALHTLITDQHYISSLAFLSISSVLLQIYNTGKDITMSLTKAFELWQSRHFGGVVFGNNFTQDAWRMPPRQSSQVYRRFSMSISCQYTPFSCPKWKDMPWSCQVQVRRRITGQSANGNGTVRGTDSSCNSYVCNEWVGLANNYWK